MPSTSEAWKNNLRSKVGETSDLLLRYLTGKDVKTGQEAGASLVGLMGLFATDQMPHQLRVTQDALRNLAANVNHAPTFRALMQAYNNLPSVAQFEEDELPSFDKIFDSYKADADLQSLVNELTNILQKILDEGDENLSAQVARELEIILSQLKKRDSISHYELQVWADLAMKVLILATEVNIGTQGFVGLLYEGAKVAFRIKRQLLNNYVEAQDRLMTEHKLKFSKRAIASIPDINNEDEMLKRLPAPDAESHGSE